MKLTFLVFAFLATATASAQHPLDTIQVQRLVVDTTTPPTSRAPRLKQILEVREKHNEAEGVMDPGMCGGCVYHDYYRHIKYLTSFRGPIPFGWVVFEGQILAEAEPVPIPPPHTWELRVDTMKATYPADTLYHMFLSSDSVNVKFFNSDSSVWITHLSTGSGSGIGWTSTIPTRGYADGLSSTLVSPGPSFFDWLPRRLKKRYLRFYHFKNTGNAK